MVCMFNSPFTIAAYHKHFTSLPQQLALTTLSQFPHPPHHSSSTTTSSFPQLALYPPQHHLPFPAPFPDPHNPYPFQNTTSPFLPHSLTPTTPTPS
ncbi:hypothetical protein Pcinc_012623 [Petrolisthes cinctipes]|uniref:Uncharacterized protein n=1 Tax=Petrolisthes cinctipes TaxID=88211 RepID=A0AAE1FYF1_PETCI|nr:hypothetical protein Pcinc_012623 [Petrolisthes cinctipes]